MLLRATVGRGTHESERWGNQIREVKRDHSNRKDTRVRSKGMGGKD